MLEGRRTFTSICVSIDPWYCSARRSGGSSNSGQRARRPSAQSSGGRPLDIRRATRDEIGEVNALLEASGLSPLPTGISLSNVLVGREQGSVIGVIALEVVARRGLTLWAAVSEEHRKEGRGRSLARSLVARAQELGLRELYAVPRDAVGFFAGLGFSPVSIGSVPDEVRCMRTFRNECGDSTEIMRLGLETRI
jgi:N-acetylglutamate synthase-like GNAT family acetyltransferase